MMISATFLPARSSVVSHWPALTVALFSAVGLLQVESANFLVATTLVVASLWLRGFWLVSVPTLICFGGLELSVFIDPELGFVTPLNAPFLPETWLLCCVVRVAAYWAECERAYIDGRFLALAICVFGTLALGSLSFLAAHRGLPFMNKAPLKFLSWVLIAGVLLSEVRRRSCAEVIWYGLIYATVVGAFQRVFILVFLPVKEPGLYAFTGVFVTACMIYIVGRTREISRHRLLLMFFWTLLLLMHVSASRTQLALLALTILILLTVLTVRSLPIVVVVFGIAVASVPFLQRDFLNYLIHKIKFFLAVASASDEIGDSANVRRSTFLNLVDGSQTDALNLMFGRGLWGHVEFSAYPTSAIHTERAFSDLEHSLGMYYHLHFFLNEVLFYFGFFGIVVLIVLMFLAVRSIKHPLELVLIVYFLFAFMFRLELILLVPAALFAWRSRLAMTQLFDRLGRVQDFPGISLPINAGNRK
jgi:hypothetical protein